MLSILSYVWGFMSIMSIMSIILCLFYVLCLLLHLGQLVAEVLSKGRRGHLYSFPPGVTEASCRGTQEVTE